MSAGLTAVIAVVALAGWGAHVLVLARIAPGLPTMKANAAVSLVLASFAAVVYGHCASRGGVRYAAAACAVVVLLVGAGTLAEYAFGWRLGIDQLLFHARAAANVPYPGRPAANAALGFVMVGLALLCWEVRLWGVWVSHLLAWLTATLGLLALAGYATGATALTSLPSRQGIAVGAAVGLILLPLSILLARPERGEIALLASGGHGGLVLRRLLPVAVLLPACAGLSLAGERLGWFASATGEWLSAIVGTIALIAVAWAVALESDRAELAAGRLAAVVESSQDAILSETVDGVMISWNLAARRMYGYRAAEAVGRHVSMLSPPGREQDSVRLLARVAAGERVDHLEVMRRRKDGSLLDVSLTLSPVRDRAGQIVGISEIARDFTEHKRAERELERLAQAAEHSSDAIVSFDLDGRVRHWNRGAERILDLSAEEAIGLSVEELNAEASARTRDAFARALAGQAPVRLEYRRRRKDGTLIDLETTITPWRVDGRVVGTTSVAVDVTERKRAERELERLAQAAEQRSDAIVSFDLEMRVRHWNLGAERISGFRADEVLGLSIDELNALSDEPPQTRVRAREAIAKILRGEPGYQVEAQRRRRDGTVFDVLSTFVAWRVDGRVVGATNTTVDITQRKRAERVRERALADLEEAQRVAKVGSWTWDPASDEASWSAQMYEIFGRDPSQGPAAGEAFFALVAAEDRERIRAGYAEVFGGGPSFTLDYRIVTPDGRQRTVHAVGRADPARAGCYLGTVQDVSEQRAAQHALREAEERFRLAFEEAPIGMAVISTDGTLEHANAALGMICGRVRHELHGLPLRELIHPGDNHSVEQELRALAGGAVGKLVRELRVLPASGSPVEVSIHATALRYGAGRPDRLLCQVQDITDRKQYESRLQFMADHDPLTGLMNRRKFEAELDRHVEHVKRYGPQGALLMLDIDNFKAVNDTLGHNAGDELIISIGGVLSQRVRASDVLARLGGDEFAVLLPRADQAEAARVADALVRAVRENAALLGGQRQKVTTSVGIAMFDATDSALTGESALIEGDLAMYDAKENGRDGYAFYASADHRISRTKARLTWVARIEQALAADRFALVAQPILDLRTNRVGQHELLLRMLDDDGDMIPPAAFLYLAERFELIAGIDQWVVAHAIELIEQHPDLRLHVNISGKSLGNQQLLATIDERLRASRIDPRQLIFEVTETAAVANITDAQTFVQRLRDHGCRFALDDFGAGFGSFYYLKHLPFDYVKIDGEFVQNATNGRVDQLVIDAVVRIAQGLGNETIAEFVTNEQTQRMVARLGVDHAQGYHIGRPIPIQELLNRHTLENPI